MNDDDNEIEYGSYPILNINDDMSKKKQARKIVVYLISIMKPAKTTKGVAKQRKNALAQFKKHFPELFCYLSK